ncbi:hypothetical protein [Gloeobacter violaceus]|uniref:Gll3320 protein n=1 Tax=Gloeobacter violaceus (strain ATCC 29082 / PCC 7421) TaxID=251221 RepID=Q7NG53_GLOVI|nr:hypothetical protein [Gloeobacter violaceus]BAC91261.1 gll3320 [Gloeobacter violaceus PCC 7421]
MSVALEHLISRLDENRLTPETELQFLRCGEEAFQFLLDCIRSSRLSARQVVRGLDILFLLVREPARPHYDKFAKLLYELSESDELEIRDAALGLLMRLAIAKKISPRLPLELAEPTVVAYVVERALKRGIADDTLEDNAYLFLRKVGATSTVSLSLLTESTPLLAAQPIGGLTPQQLRNAKSGKMLVAKYLSWVRSDLPTHSLGRLSELVEKIGAKRAKLTWFDSLFARASSRLLELLAALLGPLLLLSQLVSAIDLNAPFLFVSLLYSIFAILTISFVSLLPRIGATAEKPTAIRDTRTVTAVAVLKRLWCESSYPLKLLISVLVWVLLNWSLFNFASSAAESATNAESKQITDALRLCCLLGTVGYSAARLYTLNVWLYCTAVVDAWTRRDLSTWLADRSLSLSAALLATEDLTENAFSGGEKQKIVQQSNEIVQQFKVWLRKRGFDPAEDIVFTELQDAVRVVKSLSPESSERLRKALGRVLGAIAIADPAEEGKVLYMVTILVFLASIFAPVIAAVVQTAKPQLNPEILLNPLASAFSNEMGKLSSVIEVLTGGLFVSLALLAVWWVYHLFEIKQARYADAPP